MEAIGNTAASLELYDQVRAADTQDLVASILVSDGILCCI